VLDWICCGVRLLLVGQISVRVYAEQRLPVNMSCCRLLLLTCSDVLATVAAARVVLDWLLKGTCFMCKRRRR